jgi:LacI family transcriptional regulator
MKKKIKDYAESLKYQPNPHAKSLRSSKTKNIAVLVPDISNYFFSLSLKGIESVIHEKGYNLMIYQTNDNLTIEEQLFGYLENGMVAGALSAVSSNKKGYIEHVKRLNELIPIIFFDRSIKDIPIPHVTCNDYEASITATKHLIEKGCKNILFIGIDKSISVTNDRLNGYMYALQSKNIPVNKSYILLSESVDDILVQLRNIFDKPNKIDAVFSSVERYTMQLYAVCKEMKIGIPEKLKVISFSNSPYASLLDPALSTVIPPAYEIGKEAANMLFQLLQKKKEDNATNKIIPCTLSFSRSSMG